MTDYLKQKGVTQPDSDPDHRHHNDLTLDDLQDPWWHTPCEDCGEVPIRLVPYGVNECKCLRERDR
jgi:hypothetical protein